MPETDALQPSTSVLRSSTMDGVSLSSRCPSCLITYIVIANAGEVINVFYAILIGSFSLALLAPEMQGSSSQLRTLL